MRDLCTTFVQEILDFNQKLQIELLLQIESVDSNDIRISLEWL